MGLIFTLILNVNLNIKELESIIKCIVFCVFI